MFDHVFEWSVEQRRSVFTRCFVAVLVEPLLTVMKSEVHSVEVAFGVRQDIIKTPPNDGLFGETRTDEG